MAVVKINYEEGDQSTYRGVEILYGKSLDEIKVFNTGDFVQDWYDHTKFIIHELMDTEYHISNSSTVDQFIISGDKYDPVYLYNIEGNIWELLPLEKYDVVRMSAVEFFVHKGENLTWEEMQEKYDK